MSSSSEPSHVDVEACDGCGSKDVTDASVPGPGISCIRCGNTLCVSCWRKSACKYTMLGEFNHIPVVQEAYAHRLRLEQPDLQGRCTADVIATQRWTSLQREAMKTCDYRGVVWYRKWGGYGMLDACIHCEKDLSKDCKERVLRLTDAGKDGVASSDPIDSSVSSAKVNVSDK
jgi:hypothetical protein